MSFDWLNDKDYKKCENCNSELSILKDIDKKIWEIIGIVNCFPKFFAMKLKDRKKEFSFERMEIMLKDELTLEENRLKNLSNELDIEQKCQFCGSGILILKYVDKNVGEIIGLFSGIPKSFRKNMEYLLKEIKQLNSKMIEVFLIDETIIIENRLRSLSDAFYIDVEINLEEDKKKKLEEDVPAYMINTNEDNVRRFAEAWKKKYGR